MRIKATFSQSESLSKSFVAVSPLARSCHSNQMKFGILARRWGPFRWETASREMRQRLEAARTPIEPKTVRFHEIEGLPSPVQRYLRTALTEGQPIVSAVTVHHAGTFNMSPTGERWRPFTSIQRVITRRPGFDWEGRISLAPGLKVRVHDAYIAGEGILHASLFGLITLAKQRGTPDMAEGELMRFLAETAWYPTALLPGQGIRWEGVDDASARAMLTDGETSASLLFRFDAEGLIESVRADARGRMIGRKVIPTPWEGRWRQYERHQGMCIPIEGEVSWILPEGPKPYWRGRITKIAYEFAE